jgi:hypothetical protein
MDEYFRVDLDMLKCKLWNMLMNRRLPNGTSWWCGRGQGKPALYPIVLSAYFGVVI